MRSSARLSTELEGALLAPHARMFACKAGWVVPLAFFVGLACYINCIACDFVFDDRLAILNNKDVQHGAALAPIWSNDFWGKGLQMHDSHKSYRPLTILSFRFHTWWRQGEPRPADFHAANALLHALVCGCVAELAARTCGVRSGGRRIALLSSLVFAAHPIHVEAVTGTVGRAELLCALACMAGFASHGVAAGMASHGVAAGRAPPGGGARGGRVRACAGAAAMVASIAAAVLTKETGVTLVPMLAAQERPPSRRQPSPQPQSHSRTSMLPCCTLEHLDPADLCRHRLRPGAHRASHCPPRSSSSSSRLGASVRAARARRRAYIPPMSPLHLPYIFPTSPLHLHYISPISP